MADILLFPAERTSTAAHRTDALRSPAAALAATSDAAAWLEDDVGDIGDLDTVASLAAAPSQSLVGLVDKMQVLVARLAPDDGTDAGLCLAEANLLRSVLRDLRAFVADAIFAAQGAGVWAPVSVGANLLQANGTGSCAGDSLAHYQV
ncbi:hypothetical protein E2C06_32685 [Dankookia rubra]|uniref:Uncharacterized protein n=1 Tax=Dankookia rubra TaxID=1442381 RepID=A0A4R5Q6C1_9PROT|nr:hypothetical protein [Dankookia rubra]TDH58410.1 hypothetical protein E2C06_32685 [Dankookia rubra]